jgi:hypothetical protein
MRLLGVQIWVPFQIPMEETMRALRTIVTFAVLLLLTAAVTPAQNAEMSDADYVKQALSAAPQAIGDAAGVIRMGQDGAMHTLRPGTNGFTCMVMGTDKMCNDANSMAFIHAMMMHTPPPDKIGISYMLAGDDGASNTDPYARARTADLPDRCLCFRRC